MRPSNALTRTARLLAALLACAALPACRNAGPPARDFAAPPLSQPTAPLRLDLSRAEREAAILDNLRKPVMGRRAALGDVKRVVEEDAPLIAEAARQPEVEDALRQMAADERVSLDEARERWQRLQEADILLESGGDPEEVSVAHAVGVAQWISETAQRAGMKIDLPRSNQLSARIDDLKRRAAWCAYLSQPGADPHAPGAPPLTLEQARAELPGLTAELAQLRAERAAADPRYDPRQALLFHARYLLRLYPRFPDPQWIFQAFHGGEAGATRLLKKYLGKRWPGSTAQAIRHGIAGKPLHYEEVYFTATPHSHTDAFSYLYARGDDHRHYWWKLRAAMDAIALYRRDPDEFQRQWASLLPGRAREAYWYPDGPKQALPDPAAVAAALHAGRLVPPPAGIARPPTAVPQPAKTGHAAPPDPPALRPEAAGLLRLVAAAYRGAGGKKPLVLGDTTVPQAALDARKRAHGAPSDLRPPAAARASRPGGGPPADFDFHTTGLAFDLPRPTDPADRKRLEYALGYFQDRRILWLMDETDGGPHRYHVVPNPRFAPDLARLGGSKAAPLPKMPGL